MAPILSLFIQTTLAGGKLIPIPTPQLVDFLENQYSRFSPAVVAEDASTFWIQLGSTKDQSLRFGWYPFDIRTGNVGFRDLFTILYKPLTTKAVLFSISQSKQVYDEPPNSLGGNLRGTKTADANLVAVLNGRELVVTSSAWYRTAPKPQPIAFVGKLDLKQRGNDPNQSLGIKLSQFVTLPQGVACFLSNGKLSLALLGASYRLVRAVCQVDGTKLTFLSVSEIKLPARGDLIAYDWRSGRILFSGSSDMKAPLEWSGSLLKEMTTPIGVPQRLFYSNGRLYCISNSKEGIALFAASANRKHWKELGPFLVYGQSASQRYWLVERMSDRKWFLADFGN